jgi:hypothetical protein
MSGLVLLCSLATWKPYFWCVGEARFKGRYHSRLVIEKTRG